jgi:hypothetical protein
MRCGHDGTQATVVPLTRLLENLAASLLSPWRRRAARPFPRPRRWCRRSRWHLALLAFYCYDEERWRLEGLIRPWIWIHVPGDPTRFAPSAAKIESGFHGAEVSGTIAAARGDSVEKREQQNFKFQVQFLLFPFLLYDSCSCFCVSIDLFAWMMHKMVPRWCRRWLLGDASRTTWRLHLVSSLLCSASSFLTILFVILFGL